MEFDYLSQPGQRLIQRDLVQNGKPLVSIITPFYNGGKYFEQTFNCVMNQTFPWFEWIVVDDGSTQSQDLEILEEYVHKDCRIRVLHKKNGGISSARNYGIEHAQSDLILPLDCDDLLEPTFIEICWWMLKKNPKASWSYTDSVGFQGQEYLWRHDFDPEGEKKENLLTATALIRKKALQDIGLYDASEKHYNEDWVVWLKILANGGFPAQAKNEYLFWYRRSDSGVLSKVKEDPDIAARNKKLLENAASKIQNPHPPVIYPISFCTNYDTPEMTDWSKCIFTKHDKIRVALLIPWTVMGGADKFCLDLVAGLDKTRFDIGLITTLPSENGWGQQFRKYCADVFNLPNFVEPKDFAEFISYYIKSRDLDVLMVSNSYIGAYLVPWLRQNFPRLAIVDYVHMEEWYYRKGGHARTSGVLGGVLDRTYVCNSATREVMLRHFGRSPQDVETVHIGVDETYFQRNNVQSGVLYQESGIESNRPVVLFICRLQPQKRPFLMLEIAARVKKQIPEVAFAVVGDGELETELRARATRMGLDKTVYFMGARKEVRPYYKDAKVTLICSLKEGLSLTAYESCAMGVPVVSADVGGQRDLVGSDVGALIPCLQDEETGIEKLSYTEEEIDAYVESIVRILGDKELWQKLSINARTKIENGFTIRDMVNYFEHEFERLCEDTIICAHREQKAQALQLVSPLAADYYTMMTQAESLELHINWLNSTRTLAIPAEQSLGSWLKQKMHKVLACWKKYGAIYTIRKIWSKLAGK